MHYNHAAYLATSALLPCFASAWLPQDKIRGVNLGGHFIIEPWMMYDEWNAMGCGDQKSEFDCVMKLGQDAANQAFQDHWGRWITQDDITQMKDLGLNTIRIPLGYWIVEDLIDEASEYFPRGGFPYLETLCGWANDAGLYVILDLHGAPGAQQPNQPFTGQYAPTAGFYNEYNYNRALEWIDFMTNVSHTNPSFASVGTIEVVNEPLQNSDQATQMIQQYYPAAYERVRSVESGLGVPGDKQLHVQMMSVSWGSGEPTSSLPSGATDISFDDHNYVKWNPSVEPTREAYMSFSCSNGLTDEDPLNVGEWSLSVKDGEEWGDEFSLDAPDAAAWYKDWWSAQVMGFEKKKGWIFWTWKVNWIGGKNEWRWGYQQAVAAGAIPNVASEPNRDACN